MAKSQLLRLEAAQGLTAGPKNLMLSSWKLFTKQIMTSNEYAEIRKHVYKPLNTRFAHPSLLPLIAEPPDGQRPGLPLRKHTRNFKE